MYVALRGYQSRVGLVGTRARGRGTRETGERVLGKPPERAGQPDYLICFGASALQYFSVQRSQRSLYPAVRKRSSSYHQLVSRPGQEPHYDITACI